MMEVPRYKRTRGMAKVVSSRGRLGRSVAWRRPLGAYVMVELKALRKYEGR